MPTLASDLQTLLQSDFGNGFTVTDNSTAGGELHVDDGKTRDLVAFKDSWCRYRQRIDAEDRLDRRDNSTVLLMSC